MKLTRKVWIGGAAVVVLAAIGVTLGLTLSGGGSSAPDPGRSICTEVRMRVLTEADYSRLVAEGQTSTDPAFRAAVQKWLADTWRFDNEPNPVADNETYETVLDDVGALQALCGLPVHPGPL